MTWVEEAVRESLRGQAHRPPPVDDLADLVIAAARRTRARRSWYAAVTGACGVVVTLLAATVTLHAAGIGDPVSTDRKLDGSGPAVAEQQSDNAFAVVVNGLALSLPGGRSISLGPIIGGVGRGYQIQDGWLLLGKGSASDGQDQSLWLAKSDGSLRCLVADTAGPVAVARDGRRLAWSTGRRLVVGRRLLNGTLEIEYESPAPGGVLPQAIVDDTVLVTRKAAAGVLQYDTWQPKRGNYAETWGETAHVREVFGPGPDPDTLIGLVAGSDGRADLCLATLNPADALATTRSVCGVARFAAPTSAAPITGSVSPDSQWLAARTVDNLTAVIGLMPSKNPMVVTRWSTTRPGVWLDSRTMIAPDGEGWLRQFRVTGSTSDFVRPINGTSRAAATRVVPLGQA